MTIMVMVTIMTIMMVLEEGHDHFHCFYHHLTRTPSSLEIVFGVNLRLKLCEVLISGILMVIVPIDPRTDCETCRNAHIYENICTYVYIYIYTYI